jgi:diguanylate cyclase (GGDEF)-like protein
MIITLSLFSADITIEDGFKKNDNFSFKYYLDKKSLLEIDDIQNIEFKNTIPSQFTLGYNYENVWFKLEIKNSSQNEDYILYFTESIWSTLDLYSKNHTGWTVQKNGLSVSMIDREISDSSPAFDVHIPRDNTSVFYIKGRTIAGQIGEFQLFSEKEYFNPNRITLTEWYMIYAFVLFIFILLNLYNFIIIKERIYAYYIMYISIYIFFSFMHSGVYIALGFPNWHEGLHVLGQLVLFALLLFTIEFLSLENTYPTMKRVFNYLALGALFFAYLLSKDIPYATVASNIFFSGTLIFIVFVALRVLKHGFDGAKYYLIALTLFLPTMAIMAMNFNAMLENTDFTRYTFLAGAFVEIFLFTILLTNRYMNINRTNNLLTQKTIELENIKKQLTIEATTDVLSGLYNRRYFYDIAQQYFKTAKVYNQKFSILMVDIDDFKSINDNYGHDAGDEIIKRVASAFTKLTRKNDIVARYGGDEFIILLPDTKLSSALELAERTRSYIDAQHITHNHQGTIHLTVSVGVTQLNYINDISIDETIKRCDEALYTSKTNGKNMVSSL